MREKFQQLFRLAVSMVLLSLDLAYRSRYVVYAQLRSFLRVAIYGVVGGGALAAGLALTSRLAVLAPLGTVVWRDVAFTWGLAAIVAGIFGIAWLLIRSVTAVGLNLTSRLAEVASRPIVVDAPSPRRPEQATSRAPARPPAQKPGSGDYGTYSDEAAYLNEMKQDLLNGGMSEESVSEMLKTLGKGAEV